MNKINNTAFISQEELASRFLALDINGEQYERAGVPLVVRDGKIHVDDSDSHTIVFGATGSKKTRMFVMPTVEILSRAGESFFVSDPKGEVYRRTAAGVYDRGYDVYCLNLRDFSQGKCWNPFALAYDLYHYGDRSKAYELVGDIASALFRSEARDDFFWASTAINVMTGFILMMFENGSKDQCTLKNLLELWTEYQTKRKEFLNRAREKFKGTLIYTKISSIDTPSDKTTGSIDAYVDMGMNRLSINEEFVDYLSHSDFDFYEMAKGKTAIYLIVPDESDYYHFVVGLFVKQFYTVLVQHAQQQESGQIPNRMNFLMDEFCNIPEIPEFSNIITASRSRNIRFCLVIQSKKQMYAKYDEKADVILGNCNNWIYLYSREAELLSELSQLCGEVVYENSMKLPLISTFDLQHLNKERGEALLLTGRNQPCITQLPDIDEYPFPRKELTAEMLQPKDRHTNQVKVSMVEPTAVGNAYCYQGDVRRTIYRKPSNFGGWLVATCEGMILYDISADIEAIKTGYAMMKLFVQEERLFHDRKKIKWYWTTHEVKEDYERTLVEHPEYVFLTIEELGGEKKFNEYDPKDEIWDLFKED